MALLRVSVGPNNAKAGERAEVFDVLREYRGIEPHHLLAQHSGRFDGVLGQIGAVFPDAKCGMAHSIRCR